MTTIHEVMTEMGALYEARSNPVMTSTQVQAEAPSWKGAVDRLMRGLSKDKKRHKKTTTQLQSQINLRELRGTVNLKKAQKKANTAGKAIQTATKLADYGDQAVSAFDDVIADFEQQQDIFKNVLKDAKIGTNLYMLGVDAMQAKVTKREIATLERTLEELEILIENEPTNHNRKLRKHLKVMIRLKKKTYTTQVRKLRYRLVDMGVSTTDVVLKDVLKHVTELSQLTEDSLNIANSSIKTAGQAVFLALKIQEIATNNSRIKQYRVILKEELEKRGGGTFKAARLNAIIRQIEEEQANNKISASKTALRFVVALGKKTTEVLQYPSVAKVAKIGESALKQMAKATKYLSFADATVGFAFNTYNLVRNFQKHKKIKASIVDIQDDATKKTDQICRRILEAKVNRLERHRSDSRFGLFTKSISVLSSTLSLVAATEAVLILAGVTLGATATAAFSATGIGAAVIGGTLVALSVGAFAYQNRHRLQYVGDIWKLPYKKLSNKIRIARVEKAKKKILKKMRKEREAKQKTGQVFLCDQLTKTVFKNQSELSQLDQRIERLKTRKLVLKERGKTAVRLRNFRAMKAKMKGWDIEEFTRFEAEVRDALSTPSGKARVRSLLKSYNYTFIEEITFDHVMRFVLSEKTSEKIFPNATTV